MTSIDLRKSYLTSLAALAAIDPCDLPLHPGPADVLAFQKDLELIKSRFMDVLRSYGEAAVETIPGAEAYAFTDLSNIIDDGFDDLRGHLNDLEAELAEEDDAFAADPRGFAKAQLLGVD